MELVVKVLVNMGIYLTGPVNMGIYLTIVVRGIYPTKKYGCAQAGAAGPNS